MSQPIRIHAARDFKERSLAALNDPAQRKNFRGAMDFLQMKRRAQFGDKDELTTLRDLGEAIRRYALANLLAAMLSERWASGMPTNALVISGPSKTADIQQVLAYGAHGPREVIVLLCLASGGKP